MWLKVLAVLAVIGSSVALQNPPVTKWRPKSFDNPDVAVVPFIDNPPKTYRLPNDSFPLQYGFHMRTDINSGIIDFHGYSEIQVQMRNTADEIVLHSKMHKIIYVDVYSADFEVLEMANLTFTQIESHDFLVIKLNANKTAGDIFWLDIEFTGTLRDDGEGFYRGSYVNETGQTVWYATTQFEITEARHAFPCYDEPGIRAPITIEIDIRDPYTAVSNMPVASIVPNRVPGYVRYIFEKTPPMQMYLLAFLISDYKFKEAPSGSTRIQQKVYATPQAVENGWADYAASIAGAVVRELENYIGFDYPLPKLDHAALTYFIHGAMENFGLITYRQDALLLDPNEPDSTKTYRENGIVGLIAHETAHQWFGDVISPEWWSYTWLNEGFATFFTVIAADRVYPDRSIWKNFVRNNLPAAFGTDEQRSTWSMNHYTEDPPSLWTKFNNIGYSKAGCIIRMFQETMTEETFAKGLKFYMTENNFTAATPDTLHRALQKAYDQDFPGNSVDIGTLMGTWENQAGYPLVSVRLNGNNLDFSQTRYPFTNGELYSIPLTFSTKTRKNFNDKSGKQWLTGSTLSLPSSAANFTAGDWLILNNQQVGYYRVDYSTELWQAIVAQLVSDFSQIHPINRAVLRDEIYMGWKNFAQVTAAHVLDSLLYFSVEDEAISWSKSNSLLSELAIRLRDTEVYDRYLQFLKDLTGPQLNKMGIEGFGGEHTDVTDLRGQLRNWNCFALNGNCLLNEYQKWFQFNSTNVATVSFNFCYAMTLLAEEPFNQILTAVTTDKNYTARSSYLSSLGCNRNDANLKALLQASIDTGNNLEVSERMTIIRSTLSKSQLGLENVLTFVERYFSEISSLDQAQFVAIITELAQYVNPGTTIGSMIRLRDTLRNAAILNQTQVDTINGFMTSANNWESANFNAIKTWFDSYTEPITTTSTTSTTTTSTTTTTQAPTSSSSPAPGSTTQSPTTTPQAASSIFVSLNVLAICIILSFFFGQH